MTLSPLLLRRAPIAFILLIVALGAAAQPSAFRRETVSVEIAGVREDVDIYRPVERSSIGVAIVAHGFTRSRARHRDLGQALARAGITAVIPDLPNVLDHWGNGDAVVDLVQKLESGQFGIPPTERMRLVLIGTSAGGLATLLAAAALPGLAGWIGLDPVDRTGSGTTAAAELASPAVVLLGGGSSCNLFGSGRDIAGAVPRLVRRVAFKDASHCDFEDPTNNFCRALCGKSSSQLQTRIRGETVRAALDLLHIAAGTAEVRPSAETPGASE
jgi:pimeloyl-ACP methyl ester carboxylesterase